MAVQPPDIAHTRDQCVMVKFNVIVADCEPLEAVTVITALVGAGVPGVGVGVGTGPGLDELPPPPPQAIRLAIMNIAIQ